MRRALVGIVLVCTTASIGCASTLKRSLGLRTTTRSFVFPGPYPGQLTWRETTQLCRTAASLRVEPAAVHIRLDDEITLQEHIRVTAHDSAGTSLGELRIFDWQFERRVIASLTNGDLLARRIGETVLTVSFPRNACSPPLRLSPSAALFISVSDTGTTTRQYQRVLPK